MIGKHHWFKRRKYTGWGFSPATWQGWVYLLVLVAPILLITSDNSVNKIEIVFLVIWGLVFTFDFIDIMVHLPKDERDRMHEAIAERNALWVIVIVLALGIGYQVSWGIVKNLVTVDPVIIIALIAGLIAKIISNIYLDKKD